MGKQPESRLQMRIRKALIDKVGGWWFKVAGGPFQAAGIPDIIGCTGGLFVALEVKTATGRPSPIQVETIRRIREDGGGAAAIVRSPEEALEFVVACKRLLRYEVDERGCWNYQGGLNKGRGVCTVGGKSWIAPRLSYHLFVAPIPKGLNVCHECDNPQCIRPSHLWVGTTQDNVDDRERKGRGRRLHGEDSPRTKLTAEQVTRLRARRAGGMYTLQELSDLYGISKAQVSLICSGKKWKEHEGVGPVR